MSHSKVSAFRQHFLAILDRVILLGCGLMLLGAFGAAALNGQAPWQQGDPLILGLWAIAAATALIGAMVVGIPLAAAATQLVPIREDDSEA